MEYDKKKDRSSKPNEDVSYDKIDKDTESFQKCIYELFEKNGILNDLRAYLRGHIVNVLKDAKTGDSPMCQKNFTQRLDLMFQALNILIAEYLLCLEFNYSLSVFISEIPLANMVFDFAKYLMKHKDGDYTLLRFKDCDVWSVLNYLGVKCDSEHASSIVEMYRSEQSPLLVCMLKCMVLYRKDYNSSEPGNTSEESHSLSAKSLDSFEARNKRTRKRPSHDKCKHYAFCKPCQSRIARVKDKYREKKAQMAKKTINERNNSLNLANFMKNVSVMEQTIIDEMFQELKSVYETEVELVREQEEKKVKRSLTNHVLLLQKKQEEMELTLKNRETELESNVQQKKKFLWGLARALREQHSNMTRAMLAVRSETERLAAKEDNLKTQLQQAEDALKKRGEEMRIQISNELLILEDHLDAMKNERNDINKERTELERMKVENECKIQHLEDKVNKSHYDLLKNELSSLKQLMEPTKGKCLVERGTVTDEWKMNNEQEPVSERVTPNKVVNDLKKLKNVNFIQPHVGETHVDVCRPPPVLTADSEHSCRCERDSLVIQMLRDENDRLRNLFQQHQQKTPLQDYPRFQSSPLVPTIFPPHTTPAVMPVHYFTVPRLNPLISPGTVNAGGGEQLYSRRQSISQWRTIRRRPAPHTGPDLTTPNTDKLLSSQELQNVEINSNVPRMETSDTQQPNTSTGREINKREKSPRSVLRAAKEKLRNKSHTKEPELVASHEKSPNAMLREAKLRLKKLEIEAEAVEKSYLDFRRRQSESRCDKSMLSHIEEPPSKDRIFSNDVTRDMERNRSLHKLNKYMPEVNTHLNHKDTLNMKSDFEKYLKEYNTFDIGETHFKNRNTSSEISKPIPKPHCSTQELDNKLSINYLETPITEFRKLYLTHTKRSDSAVNTSINKQVKDLNVDENVLENTTDHLKTKNDATEKCYSLENNNSNISEKITSKAIDDAASNVEDHSHNIESNAVNEDKIISPNEVKMATLQTFKDNINKMYNANVEAENAPAVDSEKNKNSIDTAIIEPKIELENAKEEKNLLAVEIETVCEIKEILTPERDLLLHSSDTLSDNELENLSTVMKVIVSPKNKEWESGLNISPDLPEVPPQLDAVPDNLLEEVFDAKEESNIDLKVESSKEQFEVESDIVEEYADDFSADVDNYNSHSDLENSPMSLPKTYEDENFWDS